MTTRFMDNAVRRAHLRGQTWPAGVVIYLLGLALALILVWWLARE